MKDPTERILQILEKMPDYKTRKEPRLKPALTHKDAQGYRDPYSFIINDWIPNEPDMVDLMELFILCNFNSVPFVELVVHKSLDRTAEILGVKE